MFKTLCFAVAALTCSMARADAASSARLPDGTNFVFWEVPQTFTKTYYVDGSSPRGNDRGPGTLKQPFRTIGRAADVWGYAPSYLLASGISALALPFLALSRKQNAPADTVESVVEDHEVELA